MSPSSWVPFTPCRDVQIWSRHGPWISRTWLLQIIRFIPLLICLGWCLKLQAIWLGLPWNVGWFGIGEIRSMFTSSWFPAFFACDHLAKFHKFHNKAPKKAQLAKKIWNLPDASKAKANFDRAHVWWTKWSRYCSCCLKFPRGDNGSPIWKNTKAIFGNHAWITCC